MNISLDHVVFETRDPEASAAFYKALLGFDVLRMDEFRAGEAPFLSSRVNSETILDFFPKKMWRNKKRPENPNHFCFTVERREFQNLRRRLARRKVAITKEVKGTYGAQGWAVSLYFDDPDGIKVEVRYYKEGS